MEMPLSWNVYTARSTDLGKKRLSGDDFLALGLKVFLCRVTYYCGRRRLQPRFQRSDLWLMRISLQRNDLPGSQIKLCLKPYLREDSFSRSRLEIQSRFFLTGYGLVFLGLLVFSERAHLGLSALLLCFLDDLFLPSSSDIQVQGYSSTHSAHFYWGRAGRMGEGRSWRRAPRSGHVCGHAPWVIVCSVVLCLEVVSGRRR